jgi:plastocyanin
MRDQSASRSRRWLATLAALTSLILILAACNSGNPPASQAAESQPANAGTTVTISSSFFGVAEITVPSGNVTFVNEDGVGHIVAEGENGPEAADPRITKATIGGGAQADIAFDAPGDYHITCLIHGSMNMVVHVE